MKKNKGGRLYSAIVFLIFVFIVLALLALYNKQYRPTKGVFDREEESRLIEYLKAENNTKYEQERIEGELKSEIAAVSEQLVESRGEMDLLREQIQHLQKKIEYCKINPHSLRMAYIVFDIQNATKEGRAFDAELKKLKILANGNLFMEEKIQLLSPYSAKPLKTKEEVLSIFQGEIIESLKSGQKKESYTIKDRLKDALSRVVTVRKVSNKYLDFQENSDDLLFLKVEKAIKVGNYAEAIEEIKNSVEHEDKLGKTKRVLEDGVFVDSILWEIIDYLKTTETN